MFALLQAWILVASGSLNGVFAATDLPNVALCALALLLAVRAEPRAQMIGIVVAWGISVSSSLLRWIVGPI